MKETPENQTSFTNTLRHFKHEIGFPSDQIIIVDGLNICLIVPKKIVLMFKELCTRIILKNQFEVLQNKSKSENDLMKIAV